MSWYTSEVQFPRRASSSWKTMNSLALVSVLKVFPVNRLLTRHQVFRTNYTARCTLIPFHVWHPASRPSWSLHDKTRVSSCCIFNAALKTDNNMSFSSVAAEGRGSELCYRWKFKLLFVYWSLTELNFAGHHVVLIDVAIYLKINQ